MNSPTRVGRRFAVLTLVVSLLVAGAAAPVAAADLSISTVQLPSSVTQGDSFTVQVTLSGGQTLSNVQTSLTLPAGLSCTPSGSQSVSLDGSGSGQASFSCTADAAGDYTGEVSVSASADDGGNRITAKSKQVGLRVLSPASLTLSTSLSSSSITTDGTASLTAVVHNTGDVKTGYTVSVTKPSAVENSLTAGAASGDVAPNTITTVEHDLSATSAGDHSVTVTVTGENGQTLSEALTLSVTDPSGGTPTPGSGGGGGGGGGGAPAIATSTPESESPSTPTLLVSTTGSAEGTVTTDGDTIGVDATGLQASDSLELEIPAETVETSLGDDGMALERVTATFGRETDFAADVSWATAAGESLPGAVGYVTVDTGSDFAERDVSEVRFGFAITPDRLSAAGLAPADVVLYRHHDGEWTALDTSVVEENGGTVRFEAVSPGLSTFAIGSDGAVAERTDDATTTPSAAGDTPETTPGSEPAADGTEQSASGDSAASTDISAADGADDAPAATPTSTPGFGALVALAVTALAARRRG